MIQVVVIGCGVVGAAIAYELSQVPELKITVLDKQPPAQGATGAALGVLMGVISHKVKGNAWQMRQDSICRYETLIPELEMLTGRKIPFNRQGILMLCFAEEDMAGWEKLVKIRQSQGWHLEIWDVAKLQSSCPQLNCERIKAAIYSPQDSQVEPVALTSALVDAAQRNGVIFHFGVAVEGDFVETTPGTEPQRCRTIQTKSVGDSEATRLQDVDWLVLAAGLGTSQFLNYHQSTEVRQMLDLRPVLGQALHLRLQHPLGNREFQPVITGDDIHIVPFGVSPLDYWVGATVEFSTDGNVVAVPARLDEVMQRAVTFCPALAEAAVVKTWSGLRPRPEGRPAPIIGPLPGYSNILLATGHYRNGVLLAPATAQAIRQMILNLKLI